MTTVEGTINNDVLYGTLLDDTINGEAGDDWLLGSQGNDTIDGGDGIDTVWYTGAGTYFEGAVDTISSGVIVNLATGTATGGDGNDTLYNIENVVGSDFDDTLIGTSGDNYLGGAKGANNIYDGGLGNDTIDDSDAEASNGTIAYWSAVSSVRVNLQTGTSTGGGGNDTLLLVENVIGSDFADIINGTAADNRLEGGKGDDWLYGGQGNDSINGSDGTDTVWYAGAGSYFDGTTDTISSGVTVNLAAGFARGGAGNDTITNIENVVGSDFDDLLIGSRGDNYLGGAKGANNIYDGGLGNDTIDDSDAQASNGTIAYWSAVSGVTVDLSAGTASGGAGKDTLLGVENAIGSKYKDALTGSNGNNLLDGAGGADSIKGLDGGDTIIGGLGKDQMTGGAGADTFVYRSPDDSPMGAAQDIITDFLHGTDKIDLSGIDAIKGGSDDGFVFLGEATFTHTPGELHYTTSAHQTLISGDVDGDGVADFQIRLTGKIALTADDFIL